MSSWVTVPCLLRLRDEFDQVSPHRDKGADGTIGDTAHAAGGTSDHLPDEDFAALRGKDADKVNEVHALDIDSSGPWPEPGWFDRKVKQLVAEERRRWLDPADMCRLDYIIWDRIIYSRSRDFAPHPYTGSSDPHINHAHFSARYETRAETDTRPWGVTEDDMPTADEIAKAVWDHPLRNPYNDTDQPAGTLLRYAPSRAPHDVTQQMIGRLEAAVAGLPATVLDALADADRPDAEVAAALKAALGDRADAVFRAGLGE